MHAVLSGEGMISSTRSAGTFRSQGYTVTSYRPGDDHSTNALFNKVFSISPPRCVERWQWKFLRNPLQDKNVLTVARRDQDIVACYLGVSFPYVTPSGEVVGNIIYDYCTIEEYRRGMGVRLQKDLDASYLASARSKGVSFTLGCPNHMSYKISKRLLGYRDLCAVPILINRLSHPSRFRRPLRLPPQAGASRLATSAIQTLLKKGYAAYLRIRSSSPPQGSMVCTIQTYDDRVTKLWHEGAPAYGIHARRDRAFLTWRFQEHPEGGYHTLGYFTGERLEGYLVLKVWQMPSAEIRGYIFDLFTLPDHRIVSALLSAALFHCIASGVDDLRCALPEWSFLSPIAKSWGFRESGEQLRLVTRPIDRTFCPPCLDDERWFITFADMDFPD